MTERRWICCVALTDRNGMHDGYRIYTAAPDRAPLFVRSSVMSIENTRRQALRYCERHGIETAGLYVGAVCSN